MKTQFFFGKKILCSVAIAAMIVPAGMSPEIQAAPSFHLSITHTRIEPVTLTNLTRYAGRELTVFHVSARERSMGRDGQTLKIRTIMRTPVKVRIDNNGIAQIPAISVPSVRSIENVSYFFNYMIFAVHRAGQDDVYFGRDADGSIPHDPRFRGENDLNRIHASQLGSAESRFISVPQLRRLSAQKTTAKVHVDFRRHCR